ncbi:MAG: kelch repeat-containing protein, partial [Anaerolineales bacterium]|nr:kelch repeat-containing protein [Anaerolineales bacterium]
MKLRRTITYLVLALLAAAPSACSSNEGTPTPPSPELAPPPGPVGPYPADAGQPPPTPSAAAPYPSEVNPAGHPDPGGTLAAEWRPLAGAEPPMKTEFSMVYDAAREQIIAYGGRDREFNPTNETWAYRSETQTWTNMEPETSPPWRSSHSMVYDPVHGTILMFGGTDFKQVFADLWEFDIDRNTWVELEAGEGPEPRQMHGMAFDSNAEVVILFGGRRTDGGAAFRDTWEFNPAG